MQSDEENIPIAMVIQTMCGGRLMKSKIQIPISLLLILILGMVFILISGQALGAQDEYSSLPAADSSVYLPLAINNSPWAATFGSQISNFNYPNFTNLAIESGIRWVRMDAFHWGDIEPQNTNALGYKWSAVDNASLIAANQNGMQVIGIIRDTPGWAQKIPPYSCGAVSQAALPEFANFVRDLVKRYSVPPYNIHHWEIWNEPDIVYSPELGSDSVFGCWGDASQTYYGGVYYGEMLNVIYPAIKGADPNAQVGIGGLLLDCDPTIDNTCKSGKFLNGIIRETGIHERGDNFDFISFHGYAPLFKCQWIIPGRESSQVETSRRRGAGKTGLHPRCLECFPSRKTNLPHRGGASLSGVQHHGLH